ncbi:DUF3857 domain-containing protein [uncultured Lutibacter sp.]|uniref:DUF3857 domain-containing protein n=1 Tax=Lutibacter sp. TaxID=1925666 RepID=UPI00261DA542|nr:DUF3857 domain-containing protein [uncultured Lutibacter sp.]
MKNLRIAPFFILLFTNFIYSQEYNFNISEIPSSLKKDANSVIRFENFSINIESQRKMTVTTKKAVTVFNKLGDKNKYVTVNYDSNTKIKDIKILIFDALGNEIKKVKNKEYKDVSQVDGGTLYADSRMLYYEHVPTSYPYTIFYETEIETFNTAFIPRWYPINNFFTGVQLSTFKIKHSANLTINFIESNFTNFNVLVAKEKELVTYKIENVKPIRYEPLIPSLRKMFPNVKVVSNQFFVEGILGEASNWKELGKWEYDNLYKNVSVVPTSTKEKVLKLVEGIEDPIEKAKLIYQYVQDKTRYISVQVGIGGLRPMLASDVDKLGYGDCKALTNYTKSLLDIVGVESYFTELYGGFDKMDMDFKTPSIQGNHVILNIPNEGNDIWLECTNQKVPFGYIANFTDDRDVIVVKPEGGVLKRTKKYSTKDNLQFTKGAFEINELGEIQAKVRIEASGTQYNNHLFRYDGEHQKELDLLVKKYFSNINNMNISKIEVNNNKEEARYEEDIEFSAANYGVLTNQQMLISINAFNKNTSIPKRVRDRKLPVEISRGFLDIDEVVIKLPVNFKVEYLPQDVEVKSKFGMYSVVIKKINSNTYLYKRKLQVNEGKYEKEDYELYRDFRKNIKKHDNSKIVLIK